MTQQALANLLDKAQDRHILCLGDIMLDHYIDGTVTRISPEAPVPVFAEKKSVRMPGGAANTARNLIALGAKVTLMGLVGDDADGQTLINMLEDEAPLKSLLWSETDRVTTTKTRFISQGQQLMRLDRDGKGPPAPDILAQMSAQLERILPTIDAILISDYAKGFICKPVLEALWDRVRETSIPVLIDPKDKPIGDYGPADLIKPNRAELAAMVGFPLNDKAAIERALYQALEMSPAKAILVTRAEKGLSYLARGGQICHRPTRARDVYDVSGAGDTALAALGLAYGLGADIETAAELALITSGQVVAKKGTATVNPSELFTEPDTGLTELRDALEKITLWRKDGQSIGFTNGCFDILHPGHLHILSEAKARCDRLIVGLNDDASIRRLKGVTRPVNSQYARARLLEGLAAIDMVVLFSEDTPLKLIEALKPDLLVKGGDYTLETIVGAESVRAGGGEVHIVPLLEGFSTTQMVNKIKTG